MDLKVAVLDLLESSEPLRTGEIAEQLGVEKKELDRAMKALKSEEKIFSPKRCYYSVKK